MKRFFLVVTLGIAIVILVVLFTYIDWASTLTQLRRVGVLGTAVILGGMTLSIMSPILAWHLLMRVEGIRIGFGTTLVSGLMGRAVNLISPLMYFGGEGLRTMHVARITGTPARRVLATILGAEFQLLTGFSASIVAAMIVIVGGSAAHALPISWMILATLSLVVLVALILSALLLDLRILARTIGLLMRWGIFPNRLASVRDAAADMEETVRGLLVRHKLPFLIAQLSIFVSPVASFLQPAVFFWFLRTAGGSVTQPSATQLASFFVLVELLLMLPTTPAGLGVYEGGIVGIFHLHGWSVSDGAAYAILMRLDDVLVSVVGAILLAHFGIRGANGAKGTGHA